MTRPTTCLERRRRPDQAGFERALQPTDIVPTTTFQELRPRLRPWIAELRRLRRHRLGPHATVVFENRETVLWHIQEILRIENRATSSQVESELSRYDCLVPRLGDLRATVLIDGGAFRDARRLATALASTPALLELHVGGSICVAESVEADSHPGAPVQYVRFAVDGIRPIELAELPSKLVLRENPTRYVPLRAERARALANDLRMSLVERTRDLPSTDPQARLHPRISA